MWEANQKHGHGVFTFEDGSVYDGVFAYDRMAEGGLQPTPDLFGKLQLSQLLRSEAEPEAASRAIQNLLTRHNTELKQIYRFYASHQCESQEAFVMSLAQFRQFAIDTQLVSSTLSLAQARASVSSIFHSANHMSRHPHLRPYLPCPPQNLAACSHLSHHRTTATHVIPIFLHDVLAISGTLVLEPQPPHLHSLSDTD